LTNPEISRVHIGISSCLLGEKVRFDGGHKKDEFLTSHFGRFVKASDKNDFQTLLSAGSGRARCGLLGSESRTFREIFLTSGGECSENGTVQKHTASGAAAISLDLD